MTAIRPIKIAINALGGQGGGVLAGWLVELAESNGYISQYTSVPGVAQRTGATVYYIEIFPKSEVELAGREPVLALMPVPGDVDILVASEWIEAGRAIQRGLVTPERTTLIASTHRDYTIGERSAMGDGRTDGEALQIAAEENSKKLIHFNMAALAEDAGSVISAVLFGAIAGARVLSFERDDYEAVIRADGRMVEENLAGFSLGFAGARSETGAGGDKVDESDKKPVTEDEASHDSPAVAALRARLGDEIPGAVQTTVNHGIRRLLDYQDADYAGLYLDRIKPVVEADTQANGYRLSEAVARHLALWMSYEDAVRVADLKTRESRFKRVADEVRAGEGDVVYVTEFMYPRLGEIADIMPRWLGGLLKTSRLVKWLLKPFFRKGRKISTAKLGGFLLLYSLAGLRRYRRSSFRFDRENLAIEAWLQAIGTRHGGDGYDAAVEIAKCQRLIKGYGDTLERGRRSYRLIMEAVPGLGADVDTARAIAELRGAALEDEEGRALTMRLAEMELGAGE